MRSERTAWKSWIRLFNRYAIVGVFNTCIGLGLIYVLLHAAGWRHLEATFVGNTMGVLCSYVLNRRYTFQYEGAPLRCFIRFLVISLLCYGVAYVLLHPVCAGLVTPLFGWLPQDWQQSLIVLCEAGVYTVTSFVLHRLITFAAASPASESQSRAVHISREHFGDNDGSQRRSERQ